MLPVLVLAAFDVYVSWAPSSPDCPLFFAVGLRRRIWHSRRPLQYRPVRGWWLRRLRDFLHCSVRQGVYRLQGLTWVFYHGLGGANPAVNTPRPSRGTRIESCDFIVLIGDSWFFLFVSFCLASRVEWERWALSISFVWHVACDVWLSGALFFWGVLFYFPIIAVCWLFWVLLFLSDMCTLSG